MVKQRKILNDAVFFVPFEKDGHLFQFNQIAETFVVSTKAKEPIKDTKDFESNELPDIYPIESNISIEQQNIYQIQNVFRKNTLFLFSFDTLD